MRTLKIHIRGKKMISVVIPTFQEEKFIGATLASLLRADPSMEIIMVDGESTDKTVETAKRYVNKVYVLKEKGVSKARNYGAARTEGDIILFIDASVIVPPYLIKAINNIFACPNIVGATCNNIPLNPKLSELIFFKILNTCIRFSMNVLPPTRFKFYPSGAFIAVRKEMFKKIGGFNEATTTSEDSDLIYQLSKRGKFVFINNLSVHESMRRPRQVGLFKLFRAWIKNYLIFLVYGVTSHEWTPIR